MSKTPQEMAEILAELDALDEAPAQTSEVEDAAIFGAALEAAQTGPEALEALRALSPAEEERLRGPLEGLALLSGASKRGDLPQERSAQLLAALPVGGKSAKVIPFTQRAPFRAAIAAAAAVVLFFGVTLLLKGGGDMAEAPTTQSALTVQAELLRAEARLVEVERDSLKALVSSPAGPPSPVGDHFLRQLRQARFEVLRARRQASARRM